MLLKLLSTLNRQKFECRVVSMTSLGVVAPRLTEIGIPVAALGLRRGIPNPFAVHQLIKILREFRPDILQGWMYHADLLGLVAGRAARVPKVVWNIRCSDLDFPNASVSLRAVFALHGALSRFTDATIANSTAGMNFHRDNGHAPSRWELIQNGFDLTHYRADASLRAKGRAELGVNPGEIAIGMIARFDQFKDHATFISAAQILRATQPNTVFVLAGRGITEGNDAITSQLRHAGLATCTRLLGEYSDTSRLLPSLDIATLCSLTEGFPNAVGEAMSAQLPCVATDVGDSALLLGPTGLLVPPQDALAVANRWSELIALGAEGRTALGLAARHRIEQQFSLPAITASYERLYADLASRES